MTGPAPHVLTAALAHVDRGTWPSISYPIINYLAAYTVCAEDMGVEAVLAVSARTLAERCGLSRSATERTMKELAARRVLLRHDVGDGRHASVWSINGALDRWEVTWRPERTTVLNYLAALALSTPGVEPQRYFCVPGSGVESARMGEPTADLYVPMAVHRGPLVSQRWVGREAQRSRSGPKPRVASTQGDGAYTMPLISPPSSERSSTSTTQEEHPATAGPGGPPHRGNDLAPTHDPLSQQGVTAVLGALHRATGRALWGDVKTQVVEAVAGVGDVGYIVEALDAAKFPRGKWRDAVELVQLLALTGPTARPAKPERPTTQLLVALSRMELELGDLERDGGTAAERDELVGRIENLRRELRACQDGGDQEATG